MKIAMIDGEMSNLDGNFGRLFCFAIKPLGEEPIIISELDTKYKKRFKGDDAAICGAVRDEIEQYDTWVSWYGRKFDIPFLNTRLIMHNSRPLQNRFHIDLWETCRRKLKLHSNRLEAAAIALDVPYSKTHITPSVWGKASAGDSKALEYIIEHCKLDVFVLEEVYKRLVKYIDTVRRKAV
jgi:uncharacterized protein YprB with RNaseH-like and TPR domain